MSSAEMPFGDYLKGLREAYGYTLIELGKEIGYSDAYLSQIEKGRKRNSPTIHLLKDLSDALDEPYSKLLEMAGYDELAAGQKLLEMLGASSVGINEDTIPKLSMNELKRKIQVSKELIESYLVIIDKYALEPKVANEIVDYLNEVLVMNREYVDGVLEATMKWNQLDTNYSQLIGNEDKLRSAYLDISTKREKRRLLNFVEDGL